MAKKKEVREEPPEEVIALPVSREDAIQMLKERKDLAAVMTDEGWVTRDDL